MSDTPRTDAVKHTVGELGVFCRQLERELNAANTQIGLLISASKQQERQIEFLKAHVKRLEEAGEELSKLLGFSIGKDDDEQWACSLQRENLARCHDAIEKWQQSKEAKL